MQPYIQCLFCAHIFEDGQKCKAFPKQIPVAIWDGEYDHKKPYPSDKGIRFKSNKKKLKG